MKRASTIELFGELCQGHGSNVEHKEHEHNGVIEKDKKEWLTEMSDNALFRDALSLSILNPVQTSRKIIPLPLLRQGLRNELSLYLAFLSSLL